MNPSHADWKFPPYVKCAIAGTYQRIPSGAKRFAQRWQWTKLYHTDIRHIERVIEEGMILLKKGGWRNATAKVSDRIASNPTPGQVVREERQLNQMESAPMLNHTTLR